MNKQAWQMGIVVYHDITTNRGKLTQLLQCSELSKMHGEYTCHIQASKDTSEDVSTYMSPTKIKCLQQIFFKSAEATSA